MKKIYNLILFLACMGLFGACGEDDKVVMQQPESFVLNTPKYASGIYDLQNTETIELTCSQPDYGFTAATTYSVQVSLSQDFTKFETLPTTFITAKMDVSAADVALALVNLLGVEEESDYPADPYPVYFRLSAAIADNNLGQVHSNVITLPKVKGYFALDPMVMPANMYLIGNITGNWDWNSASEMIPVHGTPGKFWAMQYLGQTDGGDNATIKFNYAREWNGNDFGYNEVTIDAASASLAGTAEKEGNIEIGNPGWYITVVTTTINGRSYEYAVEFVPPYVYLQGNVNGGNWGTTDAAYRFSVPDISLGADAEFVSPAFTAAAQGDSDGGVRASIVLEGYDWWMTEFMVFNGVFVPRGAGDDQERVSGRVGQRLSINFTKKTGKIE